MVLNGNNSGANTPEMGQSAIDEIDHAFDPHKGENVGLVKHP